MRKFIAFIMVSATMLMAPVSVAADTAEVTAIRYETEEENTGSIKTADTYDIGKYVVILSITGSVLFILRKRWHSEKN